MRRELVALPVPTGPAVLGLLPRLAAALEGSGPALLPVPAGDPGRAGELAGALGAGEPLDVAEDAVDDPTAVVLATSGSTGEPKGAMLSRSALAASAAATQRRLGGPGGWLLALPAWHIAGLQVLLRSAADGSTPTVLDTGPPFTADRFRRAAADMGSGRRYVSLVPTQLHRLLTDPAATADLAGFDAVLVGGAATATVLLDRARTAGVRVITTYGMSETCGGCVYDGRPLDGVAVALEGADPDGATGSAAGRILLSGTVLARGYRRRPGHPAFRPGGEFRTDDLGVLTAGRLTVTGRIDEVIVSGGYKIPPQPVEEALARLPGVGQVVVVGIPDPQWGEVVTAVVVPDGPAPDLTALRDADLPAHQLPRRLLLVDGLPLRGPGKPDRGAVRQLAVEDARELD